LSNLPAPYRARFVAACERVDLELQETIAEQGESIDHVYFPLSGYISQIALIDGAALEISLVGNEGMIGWQLALGVDKTDWKILVQGAGEALRMKRRVFQKWVEADSPLRKVIHRYVSVMLAQVAQNAGCTRFHKVESRLARWLAAMEDRSGSKKLLVTQAFLAYMLGVRRVGVTVAAVHLNARGLIRYTRGQIEVSDSTGLRAVACACYRTDIEVYRDVLE
jgi:CRP-like cAMP-binding protein